MKLKNVFILVFMVSTLFICTAESKMLGKNQAVFSGKLKTISSLTEHYKLSVNNKPFFIKRTIDNKLLKKAKKLVLKNVKIIYDKDNYFITFIGPLQQQLKY